MAAKKTTTRSGVFGKKKAAKVEAKPDPALVPITKPRPKTKGSRPTLAEAKAIAKGAVKRAQTMVHGAIENKDASLEYYYWDGLEVEQSRQIKLRLMLEGRGYWKADGDEFVQGVPHAEIWCTYAEVYAEIKKESKRKYQAAKRRLSQGQ